MLNLMFYLPTFVKNVKENICINAKNVGFSQSIIDEISMCFRIMGPELYFKYKTGTAVEGVDFD